MIAVTNIDGWIVVRIPRHAWPCLVMHWWPWSRGYFRFSRERFFGYFGFSLWHFTVNFHWRDSSKMSDDDWAGWRAERAAKVWR